MASSRRFPPAELRAAVARALDGHIGSERALAVALSGGRDSVALLDVLAPLAEERGLALRAMHVHHGLSPHASAWTEFCTRLCDARGIALDVARVDVSRARSTSVEAAAREMRYGALAAMARAAGIGVVALAHHADDQAETVLLQLARGAGVEGLAAMAPLRVADGIRWLRPLLAVPRSAVDAHVRERALAYVDDDSNASPSHRRNALRQQVLPAFAAIAPGYPLTLARSARHAADAARLADELAAIDAAGAFDGASLARTRLRTLSDHRARNLLRWFLEARGLRPPSSARLASMLDQLQHAASDARIAVRHDGLVVASFDDRVHVHPLQPVAFDRPWRGEDRLQLPHGTLAFVARTGPCMRFSATVADGPWSVRLRRGGEHLTPVAGGTRRRLKSLLQDARLPPWARASLPLLFCGEQLAVAPGVAIDAAFQAPGDSPGFVVSWHPAAEARDSLL